MSKPKFIQPPRSPRASRRIEDDPNVVTVRYDRRRFALPPGYSGELSDLSESLDYSEFRFPTAARTELLRRFGGDGTILGRIESEIEYLRIDAMPGWTRGRDQARECNGIAKILVETSQALGSLSEQSRDAIEAIGFGRAKLSTEELRAELHAHAAAARRHEATAKSNLTEDAEIKSRVAMLIGQVLSAGGFQLNDRRGSAFMLALVNAFAALGLDGDPRHQARLACAALGVEIHRGRPRGKRKARR